MAFLKKNCTFVKYLREMEIFFRFVKKVGGNLFSSFIFCNFVAENI